MRCPNCNNDFDTRFCPSCGYSPNLSQRSPTAVGNEPPPTYQQPPYQAPPIIINNNIGGMRAYSPKNKLVALILCLFLGWLGAHRFYTGKLFTGLLYLFTGGFFGIGVILDFITILTGSYTDKAGNFLTSGNVI